MNHTHFVDAVEKVVEFKLRAVDRIIEELVEPLADVGNPEKLIKKPYEQWTPEDLAAMIKIYGQKEPNPLSRLVFNREYEKVKQEEQEAENG